MTERQESTKRYSPLLTKLLEARGITTDADIELFLNPDYERDLHDPFLMSGMRAAVDRLITAFEANERIAIVSDFDADGIPAAVIMNDLFIKLGVKDFSVFIPHRNTEGFGLNDRIVDECIENKVNLLITLDSGMGDIPRIVKAEAAGIDVIVTDHHQPGADGAPTCIVVNPNTTGDEYPNKHLCGAGVAYKLAQALLVALRDLASKATKQQSNKGESGLSPRRLVALVNEIPIGWEKWLLDMVGIATLSDMVSLTGENRTLAHYGLMVLRKSPRPGIKALCQRARMRQHTLTDDDVVFTITPRINAASRMDEPEAAFKLLSAQTQAEADVLAEHLDSVNNARKGAVAAMTKEINIMLADRELPEVVVVGNTHWRPGLLGLAASKVAETYNRPAFVWGQGEATMIKGSCRSNGTYNIMELMTAAREHFVEFGGHKHSGGFSTTVQHTVSLEETLSRVAIELESVVIDETPSYDAELSLDDVTERTLRDIEQLAPFGMGNKKPVFLFNNCIVSSAEPFGKDKQHTRLVLGDGFDTVSAIQFFSKQDLKDIKAGDTVSILATLERDMFTRRTPVRLRIESLV